MQKKQLDECVKKLPILFRDDQFIVVGKPSGLLVHRSKIDFHEPHNLVKQLRDQLNRNIHPVHRLDKPTSGLLIVALDPQMAHKLSAMFERGEIQKSYLAVVRGFTDTHGQITHPVKDKDKPAKKESLATSCYQTLAKIELPYRVDRYPSTRYSLLTIQPLTGRRHQIRQHMKHIHHPIIGDTSYGKSAHNRLFSSLFRCNRLLLHASALRFKHPETEEMLNVYSDPKDCRLDDGQFARVLSNKKWAPNITNIKWE